MKITDLFESADVTDFERVIKSPYFQDHVAPYITETKSFDQIVGDLKHSAFLYHGSQNSYPDGVVKFQYRGAPKDTVFYSHNMVNRLSEEKFGEPVRQLLFAMNNPLHIRKYAGENEHRVLFPLGQYRLFYNPKVKDFTIEMTSASTRTDAPDHMKAAGSMFKAGIDALPEFDFKKKDESAKVFRDKYFFNGYQPVMREISEMLFEQGIVLDKEKIREMLRNALGNDVPEEDFEYMFNNMYRVYVESKKNMDTRLERYVDGLKEITGSIMNENVGHAEIMVKCDSFIFIDPEDIPELIEYYIKKTSSLGLFGDDEEAS